MSGYHDLFLAVDLRPDLPEPVLRELRRRRRIRPGQGGGPARSRRQRALGPDRAAVRAAGAVTRVSW
ncbi:hypothetical protein ACWERV_09040 [Streptomyces sp. NPDC004031]